MRFMSPVSLFQELVKSKALQRSRFLGLDVGDKYVGVSVSDDHNKIAMPGGVLLRKKSMIDLMAIDFQHTISELSIGGIIVGFPLDRIRKGREAGQVKELIDDLCATGKLAGVKYTYWNESFSSKNVELFAQHSESHPVEAKTILDKFAAIGILQGYLDFVNRIERLEALKKESDDET